MKERFFTLASSLKWHHVGFAFLWALIFAGIPHTYQSFDTFSFLSSVLRQITVLVALILARKIEQHFYPTPRWVMYIAGISLALGSLCAFISSVQGNLSFIAEILSAVLVGLATGLFYVVWQQFYASEGKTHTYLYIPLSAIASVPLCWLIHYAPQEITLLLSLAVFPFLACFSLLRCHQEITTLEIPTSLTHSCIEEFLSQYWRLMVTNCALAIVWRISLHVIPSSTSFDFGALIGLAIAIGVVMIAVLIKGAHTSIHTIFRVVVPGIAAILLLPSVFGTAYMFFIPSVLLFGFEVIHLLLIINCAIFASESNTKSSEIYLVGIAPTLVSLLVGDLLGRLTWAASAQDTSLGFSAVLIGVYLVLVLMLFLLARTENQHTQEPRDLPSEQKEPHSSYNIDTPLQLMQLPTSEKLTPREAEVLLWLLRGSSTSGIARKLFISENTVRDHIKSLYRKTQVHARQELIDTIWELAKEVQSMTDRDRKHPSI